MRRLSEITALAAILLAMATHAPASANEQGKCYQSWTEATPIVKREQLVPAKELHEQARKRHLGEPIRITLCEENGRFVYRLVLQDATGKVKNMTVDAKRPF